ncbi:recombinase family protein [Brevibacterium sp. R8603A2]|uniref:recombinase family protein n=1 Tax=Brevibacterium sp. R8603A2 TaxID=2929779 RepID=UPI001FF82342|nr:recombinase family protein [Brevibacterium sp. R8603A2]MCK1803840.1 recombinase family protein [Brevibacterium sp. R8603A2]
MPTTGHAPTPPRKCAVYLRISQDREMDGLAIERQREQCEALANYRQWEVVETYVDQSKSATDRTKSRPDYDRMVADYRAGRFTAIICYDLDRLTRQPRQLEDWIDAAELCQIPGLVEAERLFCIQAALPMVWFSAKCVASISAGVW